MGKNHDRLWYRATQARVPLTGAFELLPMCNLSCKMCYVRKTPAQVKEAGGLMPTEFWLDTARRARDLGMLFPLLTGGEPFLHPDIKTILSSMQNMGLSVSMNSNATMIDRDTARWLGKHCPTRINITLYGASEDTYARLCGRADAFQRVRNAVDLLGEYGVPVKFNASITPDNCADLDALVAYAKDKNIPLQVASYMFPPVRRDATMVGRNERMTPEAAAQVKVRTDRLQLTPEFFKGRAAAYSRFVPLEQIDFDALSRLPGKPIACRAGRCSFWVDWQGNLSNCGMYASISESLKNADFEAAWERLVQKTEALRSSPACSNCPNNHLCHACISMICNETGTPTGRPDYLCRMTQAAAKLYAETLSGPTPEPEDAPPLFDPCEY